MTIDAAVKLKIGQHIIVDGNEFVIGGWQFSKDMQGYSISIIGIDPLLAFKRQMETEQIRELQKQMCDQLDKLSDSSGDDEDSE